MQTFKDFIDTQIGVNDEEWGLLESTIKINHYKKGEKINFKDDIWTDIIYINSGLIRSYIITDNGKDFTRQLYFNTNESHTANLFVIDLTSMLTQTPSSRGFEVLADSEVLVFSKENLYALYDAYKKWEHIGRKMAELAYMNMDTYYHGLLTKNAKERYLQLKKTMSGLMKDTPQYHIASYLGITPVSLSRIKKELKEVD
jgi:CRP-like cAMP-binding protein